ncbi:MAG: propionate--CoA ligase [Aquabacterium sp.]|nr:propionate--CoA ligase [Aquabacterium sp.]
MDYASLHRRSITDRDAYWAEQARLIDWHRPPEQICDASRLPFVRWFAGGQTNLCHNAVDRHLATRADQPALIAVSSEVPGADGRPGERIYTFAELHAEVQAMAAILQSLGVQRGDRVLIYMPMVAPAVFAMLACARLGAIHSVVFGGFASSSLASRIEDAAPKVVVSADAGSRGGKVIPYKPLLDEALRLSSHPVEQVLLVDRGLAPMERVAGRDHHYTTLREQHAGRTVPCEWLDATEPSYTLYTSGTTGRPKGVQRDTGGYAVALAMSMRDIYCGRPGEAFFCTSDIGWVVGHSYIVYGPLINGMATILYEGLPTRPDGAVWWSLVERHRVTVMFSSPTAIRVLKRQDPELLKRHDLSSLRHLFLAGEPLDEPTARWIAEAIGKPIIDNYWQTETGWPILSLANGIEPQESVFGSPGVAMPGYDVQLLDELTGEPLTEPGRKGVLAIQAPLPPGCLQTVWGDDERFVRTYWSSFPGRMAYNTFDWAMRDERGYYFILGRTDDVINVAGHRLGTREIEECIASHPNVAEVAVVGVADALKGQVARAFVVLKDASRAADADGAARQQSEILATVDAQIGAVGRPAAVSFVTALPKTRSGKLLRRAIQAVCEGRDPGDLTTIEDPTALKQVQEKAVGG